MYIVIILLILIGTAYLLLRYKKLKKIKTIYVACSLTYAPKEFIALVEELKRKLSGVCTLLLFKGLSDANVPYDVYIHDIKGCVCNSDLLVAICDYPSTGLGWELAMQTEKRKKPVLAVAHKETKVTKLILDPRRKGYEFKRYDNLVEDVYSFVVERLKTL